MPSDFFSSATDLSALNGFSGNRLNRLGEQREKLDMAALLGDDRARFYILSADRQVVRSVTPFDARFSRTDLNMLDVVVDDAHLLGLTEDGAPEFVIGLARRDDWPDGVQAVDLRSITRAGTLNGEDIGAVAQARSLALWHNSHRFCARCGAETVAAQAGYSRHCPSCGANHFPRTDPVAIMLAVDGDRCLLGRSPSFPENMVSCLAGFIEVGETLEEAVRRETFEESGVKTGRVRYHSSQPWPFASSLMIGCYAEALTTDVVTDDELEMCRWFSRDETRHILANSHPDGIWSPPRMAIAHQLMRGFVEGF